MFICMCMCMCMCVMCSMCVFTITSQWLDSWLKKIRKEGQKISRAWHGSIIVGLHFNSAFSLYVFLKRSKKVKIEGNLESRKKMKSIYAKTRNVSSKLYHANWSLFLSRIIWLEHRRKIFQKTLKISKNP